MKFKEVKELVQKHARSFGPWTAQNGMYYRYGISPGSWYAVRTYVEQANKDKVVLC